MWVVSLFVLVFLFLKAFYQLILLKNNKLWHIFQITKETYNYVEISHCVYACFILQAVGFFRWNCMQILSQLLIYWEIFLMSLYVLTIKMPYCAQAVLVYVSFFCFFFRNKLSMFIANIVECAKRFSKRLTSARNLVLLLCKFVVSNLTTWKNYIQVYSWVLSLTWAPLLAPG